MQQSVALSPAPPKRVAVYLAEGFHDPILRPVHEALDGHVESLLTRDRLEVVRFLPHLVVQASFADLGFLRRHLPRTLIGSVGHGLATKGIPARIARLPDAAARRFDFMAINDETKIERYRAAGVAPDEFWLTGYPQLDPLFRGDPPPKLPLDPEQPTVLFAPTWNAGLTSANFLGPRLVELIRGDGPPLNVIIKPHAHICHRRGRWMGWWRRSAERDERVLLVDDPVTDITPYMLAADVMISDASSVIFHYLALDRPIILVTNPRHRYDPGYDPDDICWQWRDVGTEVTDRRRLAEAVAQALADPTVRAAERRRYGERLFGPLRDGRNAERVAEHIVARLERWEGPGPVAVDPPVVRHGLRARWRDRPLRLIRSGAYVRHLKGPLEDARLALRVLRGRRR